MPHVTALYRYPVKGYTPEACGSLVIQADGRVAGDRVLGFRFADSPAADDAWSTKHQFVALVNTPGLARLAVRFDAATMRMRISLDGRTLADEPIDHDGRRRLAAAIEEYVRSLDTHPLADHPGRAPLRLVGDGVTARFQDNAGGHATLHSRASLAALAASMGDPGLSELRFRSNIAIDGVEAWEEQRWMGRRIRIGQIDFDVAIPKGRCLATHANPVTGERDRPVMTALLKVYPGQEKPTFAVGLAARSAGEIRIGDAVSVHD